MMKDMPTVPTPTAVMMFFGSRLPKMPLIVAPNNGNTGISQRVLNRSIFQTGSPPRGIDYLAKKGRTSKRLYKRNACGLHTFLDQPKGEPDLCQQDRMLFVSDAIRTRKL